MKSSRTSFADEKAIYHKRGKGGGDGYFGQQKLAEKVRKSRQKCVNRENQQELLTSC